MMQGGEGAVATQRRRTRKVMVGRVAIGGGAPVSVQSMTKTDTRDARATIEQVRALADAGCDIVRCAIPDREALAAFAEVRRSSPVPLVADVHFDYRLALGAIDAGADKVRINPGNIGDAERVRSIARAAARRGIPIRVGVNSGSVERDLLAKHGGPSAEALAESALRNARLLEDDGFRDIVISVKASDVRTTVAAYEAVARATDYPLHLGVTEAGSARTGTVKSAAAMGALLLRGIGDTIRVSLTADPVEEVRVAQALLGAVGLRAFGVEVVSCPTCGRCHGDLRTILDEVEARVAGMRMPARVAVMGCEVNGPGEAREADVGVALGEGGGLLFVRGRAVGRIRRDEIASRLVEELLNLGR